MPKSRGLFSLICCTLLVVFLTAVSVGQNSPQSGGAPVGQGQTAAAAPDSDADADSADIPASARGRISETEYFALRDQEIRTRRGIDDLMRTPQARSLAVRKMQLQEQILRLVPQGINPFSSLLPALS